MKLTAAQADTFFVNLARVIFPKIVEVCMEEIEKNPQVPPQVWATAKGYVDQIPKEIPDLDLKTAPPKLRRLLHKALNAALADVEVEKSPVKKPARRVVH